MPQLSERTLANPFSRPQTQFVSLSAAARVSNDLVMRSLAAGGGGE